MSEKQLRVAIVGAGQIAETAHIPAYLRNPHTKIAAIVDTDNKQLARVIKKFKVKKTYNSVDDLFDKEEIDAVSICTPPDTHTDIALKCLQYGAHILCEKPLATDAESSRKMIAASRDNGKILMVGFHRRFTPTYQKAKKAILDGSIGHVYCVEDHFIEPNPLYAFSKSTWFLRQNVGGVLLDIAPHILDMLNFLFDDFPVAISAQSHTYLDQPVEDFCVFLVEYSNGRIGIGTASWISSIVTECTNVLGTAQNLYITPSSYMKESTSEFREIAKLRAAAESLISMKLPNLPFIDVKRANAYQLEIDHFVDRIRKNDLSLDSALNGLSVLLTIDAARKAIAEGCKVEIPSPRQL